MRATVALLLFLPAPAGAAEADLVAIVRKVDARTARRLVRLARHAERDGLHAAAQKLYAASLQYDADGFFARTKLGYRSIRGGWVRDRELAKELAALKDADEALAKERLAELSGVREEHLKEVIRVCVKYGKVEARREVLEPLLARRPRRADLHAALGHVRIGDNWVRPGLVDLVKMMPLRLQTWRNYADEPVAPAASTFTMRVPGLEKTPPFFRAAGSEVATTLDTGANVAAAVARTQGLLRFLLGKDAGTWEPSPVLFLQPEPYAALVAALHADEETRKLYTRFGNYEHKDFYAIRVWQEADAAERYAHAAGYLTMYALAGDERSAHAWLMEGFGYLLSLELFDRANISFRSITETGAKRSFTRPEPASKTRATCLKWLREQMLAGRAHPLRDMCAFSLNNLDFCASMEAYTFLRFLFLYDAAAAPRLPAALRAQKKGPPAARADRAVGAVFGKGLAELEPLWRAFVLEIR